MMALGVSLVSLADAEDRLPHYRSEKPATLVEARSSFKRALMDVAVLLKSESVDIAKLEKVHQLSYSLEAAIERFQDEEPKVSGLKELADAVEELHLASEKHELGASQSAHKKTTELFKVLKLALPS